MQIDWWTLALQTVNLLVLVWILGRFLFRPIAGIIEDRRTAAARVLDDARRAREEAETARKEALKEMSEAAAARSGLLEEAAAHAEQEKARLIAEAKREAEHLRKLADAEIGRMRDGAEAEYGRQASRLAADIARRLFERLPDEARVHGFIDGLARAVAGLPDQTRAELGQAGAPILLKAARALSPDEAEQCRKAVSEALGRDVAMEVAVEPALIAGLELESPHANVHNSFRADLDRIAQELTRDEADA